MTQTVRQLIFLALSVTAATPLVAQFEELLENPDLIEQSEFAPKPQEEASQADQAAVATPPPPPRLLSSSLHRDSILQLDASPDGRYLLSLDQHVLKIWDIEQRANIATFEQTPGGWNFNLPQAIMGAWFTNTPRQILVCTNHGFTLYDDFNFSTGKQSKFEPTAYWFNAAEQAVYVAVYNTKYNKLQLTLTRVDLSTRERTSSHTIDLSKENLVKSGTAITPSSRNFITVDPQGRFASIRFQGENPLLLVDLANGDIAARVPAPHGAIGFLPDGRLLGHTRESNLNAYTIVNPVTFQTQPLFQLASSSNLSPKLPTRLGQPLLLATGYEFTVHDLASRQTTPLQRLENRVTDASITVRGPNRTTTLIAQSNRQSGDYSKATATYLEPISIPSGIFGQAWSVPTFAPHDIAARPDDFELAIRRGADARIVRFNEVGLDIQNVDLPSAALGPFTPLYDPVNEDWQFLGSNQPRVASREARDSAFQLSALGPDFFQKEGDNRRFALRNTHFYDLSRDGQTIALHHNTAVTVVDRPSGKRIATFPIDSPYSYADNNQQLLALSPDGQTVAFAYTTKTDNGSLDIVECHDVSTGKLLWKAPCDKPFETIDFLRFSGDGRFLYLKGPIGGPTGSNWFSSRFVTTGEVNSKIDYTSAHLQAYNRAGTLVAQSSYNNITVKTLPDGKATASLVLDFKPATLAFIGSDNFLVATSNNDETLRLIDIREQAVIAEIKLFEDPKKWLVRHPGTGLFTSETSLQKDLKFIQGETITPLESYFDQFYQPRLLGSLVKGLSPKPTIPLSNLSLAPKLTLKIDGPATRGLTVEDEFETFELPTPEVTLKLEANCEGSPIADLRIYHNGKLVSGATRGLFVEDDDDAPLTETFTKTATNTFALTPGKNRFRAIAINEQGTESAPDEIIVYSEATAPESEGGIALHFLVVGINEYQNPQYNLNYAQKDAAAIEAILAKRYGQLFTRQNRYALYNSEATRENILATLDTIKSEANPRDVFIFYYAGHGVVSEDDDPEFFLAPYEITQLYGERRILRQLGISSEELLAYSRDISAQKQLFLLDACQSAGALKSLAVRGAVEERAIAQLARSSGTHWLTATGSEQFATEFDSLGHGAFTHVVLQALQGAADTGDGLVSVNELKAYVEAQVPELTQKEKGEAQYPVTYGYGQDFPLAIP
ncbi:caspase family protein [Pelagicoccus sp. SDUM812005]|uniref:caspase family protein n=1 Tax=Pelagicoccus sp. SDUM812005 TaxID=3041257 RepID=UPI0028105511|nr:caspase family protein [Pelagicoccus sp. SDUM812005]MDQ8179782.1 caspase family protein [Pelagicoccus sp. SDUM812005]